jgi:amino acid adenylation domain-containing protein
MLADELYEWARRYPDAIAVVDGESRTSYARLARAVTAIQEKLAAAGIMPGTRVGVMMRRSWRLIAAIAGIVSYGATYVPLDLEYPVERLRFMAADSDIAALCVDPALASPPSTSILAAGVPRIEVDGSESPGAWAAARTRPDQPMYIIYTSGSTGRPKGVEIPERNVTALFESASACFDFGPDDVWTLCHSYCFDFSVWEIWGALRHGGTLVIVPMAAIHDPAALLTLIERNRVTVLNQVPSAFKHLASAYLLAPRPLSLRYVIFGGEALDKPSVRQWLDVAGNGTGPDCKLVNMYGITETTVHVTYALIGPDDVGETSPRTRIGRPLSHLRVMVCDEAGEPSPPGTPGELYVAGDSLALGYRNRPELTAQQFPVLRNGSGATRYYRSGDLAEQGADGELYYLGRVDPQVSMRGYRIEPGEVENVLRQIDGISDAAVISYLTPAGETVLKAYMVGTADGLAARELRRRCGMFLPDYMVPARFTWMDSLPLTPSGKLDRLSLRALAEAGR